MTRVFQYGMRQIEDGWNWLLVPLPEGKHQIILHAEVGPDAGVLIDDLRIAHCDFFCELGYSSINRKNMLLTRL